MKPADYYQQLESSAVMCGLCAHRCRLAPGATGVCGVRTNRDGVLMTRVYGELISQAIDPIEKKPLYHFLPGTTAYSIATLGCNFRCSFCQNWQISQARDAAGTLGRDISPEQVARDAAEAHCSSIAYTYTEPTVFFEFARDTSHAAHELGIANVFVTNGYQTPETVEAMDGLVDAANVDLKSFDDSFYRQRCGARLQPVLESIAAMHRAGIHLEITTLLIPGWNDSPDELARIAEFVADLSCDIVWHVSRFHPDFEATTIELTPERSVTQALEIGRATGLRHVFAGNIASGSPDTLCPDCGEVLIARSGYRTSIRGLAASHDGERIGRCRACDHPVPVVVSFRR